MHAQTPRRFVVWSMGPAAFTVAYALGLLLEAEIVGSGCTCGLGRVGREGRAGERSEREGRDEDGRWSTKDDSVYLIRCVLSPVLLYLYLFVR